MPGQARLAQLTRGYEALRLGVGLRSVDIDPGRISNVCRLHSALRSQARDPS